MQKRRSVMPDKPCLHLHLSRIANMDLGTFHSSPNQGVFRCQECMNILIVRDIQPYRIKVVEGAGNAG
jgi:hypothetical protein